MVQSGWSPPDRCSGPDVDSLEAGILVDPGWLRRGCALGNACKVRGASPLWACEHS